jgi:DNA-binding MarR family transcriptional regulator
MLGIIESTRDYLEKLFGDKAHITSWNDKNLLPNYLRYSYEYFTVHFLKTDFYLIINEYNDSSHVSDLKKHIYQLKKLLGSNCEFVCVFRAASNYKRTQLIKENIPFIVPHKHLYIPFLGVAFSEWNSQSTPEVTKLSPTGQMLLFELITPGVKSKHQTDIGAQLALSKMSVSRAFQELESIGIVHRERFGRTNMWRLTKRNLDLWDTAEQYLFNPVVSKVYVRYLYSPINIDFVEAGETALAQSTMIGFPRTKTFAIAKQDWQEINHNFIIASEEYDDSYCIEIWKHRIPMYEGKINPLALYMTLKANKDERIQMSLEELKKHYPWEDIIYD